MLACRCLANGIQSSAQEQTQPEDNFSNHLHGICSKFKVVF